MPVGLLSEPMSRKLIVSLSVSEGNDAVSTVGWIGGGAACVGKSCSGGIVAVGEACGVAVSDGNIKGEDGFVLKEKSDGCVGVTREG